MSDEGEYMTVNEKTGGKKGQKLARFDLIPPHPLFLLAEHYGVGAQKYPARNWELGVDWSNAFAAMQRHAWKFWQGEDIDFETQTYHLAAVAWHAFALLEYMDTHPELDDRPVVTPPEGQTTFDLLLEEKLDAVDEAVWNAPLGECDTRKAGVGGWLSAQPDDEEVAWQLWFENRDAYYKAMDAYADNITKTMTDRIIYGDYDYVTPEFNTYESLGVTK